MALLPRLFKCATAPLSPIDHSYVQALKIQNLEERNEAMQKAPQQLKDDREVHM